jgi:26S proteasome regulatory subunit N13
VPAAATAPPPPTATTTILSEPAKDSKPSANTTATATPQMPSANQRIQLSDLQNILGSLNTPGTSIRKSSNLKTRQIKRKYRKNRTLSFGILDVDLAEVVTLDVMAPILTNKQVQERLIQYLPEGDVLPKNETELRNTFTTPQFRRVRTCCHAIIVKEKVYSLVRSWSMRLQLLANYDLITGDR